MYRAHTLSRSYSLTVSLSHSIALSLSHSIALSLSHALKSLLCVANLTLAGASMTPAGTTSSRFLLALQSAPARALLTPVPCTSPLPRQSHVPPTTLVSWKGLPKLNSFFRAAVVQGQMRRQRRFQLAFQRAPCSRRSRFARPSSLFLSGKTSFSLV